MKLYSFKGAIPSSLPHRIKLSNGFTKTDQTTFTAEDLEDAGYVQVEQPPIVEFPNKVVWDSETLSWAIKSPTQADTAARWSEIRHQCEHLLAETDYKVIKAVELGEPLDVSYITYRQALRDLYNNVNNVDPWTVKFPEHPIAPQ